MLLGALALAAAPAFAAGPDGDAILGVWRGSSLCTDREVAPACKDEQVRYDSESVWESIVLEVVEALGGGDA